MKHCLAKESQQLHLDVPAHNEVLEVCN